MKEIVMNIFKIVNNLKQKDNMEIVDIVTRYNLPTKFDQLPFGTLWLVNLENQEQQFFIQLSSDHTNPQWETIGLFFEKIFKKFITSESFLLECLKLYIDLQEKKSPEIS